MAKSGKVVAPVKGGWITRSSTTGQFQKVDKESGGRSLLSKPSAASMKDVSDRRRAALQRLADR